MTTSSTGTTGAKPVSSGLVVSERTARLRAETALFMRDHVLSLVSHDLRGPLNAIHSWAYVLERKLDANDPNSQRAVTGIRNGVDQQVKLLETIVDATRAELAAIAAADHRPGGTGYGYRSAEFFTGLHDECPDAHGRGLIEALLLTVECKLRVVV